MKNKKGISLIILGIIILVVIIVSTVVIVLVGQKNTSNKTEEEIFQIYEKELNKSIKKVLKQNKNADVKTLNIIGVEDFDTMKMYIPSITNEHDKILDVVEGKLVKAETKKEEEKEEVEEVEEQKEVPEVTVAPVEYTTEKVKYVDSESKEEFNYVFIPKGFKVIEGQDKIDKGLVIEGKDGSQFVWVPVSTARLNSSFDAKDSKKITGKSTIWNKDGKIEGEGVSENEIEPKADKYKDTEANLNKINKAINKEGEYTPSNFQNKLQEEYNKFYNSIKENKGFYIARFESGDLDNDAIVSKKDNTNIQGYDFYQLYGKHINYAKTEAIKESRIKSSMLFSVQADLVYKWFATSQDEFTKNYIVNARYKDNKEYSNYTGEIKPTGTFKPVNNIYDLAGNCLETTTLYSNGSRISRGWYFVDNNTDDYAASKTKADPVAIKNRSSRICLYF